MALELESELGLGLGLWVGLGFGMHLHLPVVGGVGPLRLKGDATRDLTRVDMDTEKMEGAGGEQADPCIGQAPQP